jgi:hypothetical protein
MFGKPVGPPRATLSEGEGVVGHFIVEMVEGVEEFDDAGNRYLRPRPADIVRFGYEARGTFVPLFEGPMSLIEALVADAEEVG